MMKKMFPCFPERCVKFVLVTLGLLLISGQGILAEELKDISYVPLIKFNQVTPAEREGWFLNPWAGEKKAAMSFESEPSSEYPEFVRLNYTKSDATFSTFAFFQANKSKWRNTEVKGFYIRYRAKNLEGDCQYEYNSSKGDEKYSFYNQMGLVSDGKWNILKTTPGGWCKTKQQFSFKDLDSLYLIFHGSGIVDIAEIGLIYEYSLQKNGLVMPSKYFSALYGDDSKINIDGHLDEDAWISAKLGCLILDGGKVIESGNSTEVFVNADAKGIYCAARCFKSDMNKLKANYESNSVTIYEDESVEFYIDLGRSFKKFQKISINANGFFAGVSSTLEKSGIVVSSAKFNDRWECEAFLPWSVLGDAPDSPFLAGFNVTRNCYDNTKLERSGWATSVWNAVQDFGLISFGKTQAKLENSKFDLGYIGSGKYALKVSSSVPDLLYKVSLCAPDGTKALFLDGSLVGVEKLISLSFPVPRTGVYHVVALGYDNRNAVLFVAEGNLNEKAFADIEALDIDDFALFPVPKIFEKQKDNILLPPIMKVYASPDLDISKLRLSGELKDFYNVQLTDCPQVDAAEIVLGIASDAVIRELIKEMSLENDFNKIKYDGFAIITSAKKILIAANEKRGVLYGVNAFLDMVKMTSGDIGPAKISVAKLIDWPRVENRFFCQSMHGYYPQRKYDIAFYKSMLKKFPLHFRYNGFLFELGDYYKWQIVKIGHTFSWNAEEYAELIDFINSNYTPVMPSIQSLGHMNWWLLKYNELAALREDGGMEVLCTRHPDSYKILFGFYDEAWKMCSRNPEYTPRYFYTSLDEVRWQTFATPEEKRCKYCHGIPKKQIFLEHIKKLNSYIKNYDAKMLMFTDMLTNEHNGLNEFKCAEILNDIPRDVIMCHWSHLDHPSIAKFSEMGFENWKILTSYQEDRTYENMTKGYGFGVYTYHWWLGETRCHETSSYGLMAQTLSSNNFWNGLPDDGSEVWRKDTKIYGTQIMRNWSRKPLLNAGKDISTIDLSPLVNKTVSGKDGWFMQDDKYELSNMDFKLDKIAGIPVSFAKINDNTACLLLSKVGQQNAIMKLGKKMASLLLLHAAHLDEKDSKTFWDRSNYDDPLEGKKVVKYTVKYIDGTTEEFSINYMWNIGKWLINPNLRKDVFSKYVADSRYIWEGKTAYAQSQNIDNDIAIYQYEWVNPFPEKDLSEVKIDLLDNYLAYALLAVSCRESTK